MHIMYIIIYHIAYIGIIYDIYIYTHTYIRIGGALSIQVMGLTNRDRGPGGRARTHTHMHIRTRNIYEGSRLCVRAQTYIMYRYIP